MRAVQPRTIGWKISSAWGRRPQAGAAAGIFRALASLPSSTPLSTSPTITLRHQAAPGARLSCLICRAWLLHRSPSRRGRPEAGAAPSDSDGRLVSPNGTPSTGSKVPIGTGAPSAAQGHGKNAHPGGRPDLYDYFDFPERPEGWGSPIKLDPPEHAQRRIEQLEAKRKTGDDVEKN